MPRYVADIMIFARCEIDCETHEEASEHFSRTFGTIEDQPDLLVTNSIGNNGTVRLIDVDPSIGMIGQRTEIR